MYLEQAAAYLHPTFDTLFSMDNGSPFAKFYFSTKCSQCLSFEIDGQQVHITPDTVRHKFSTLYTDFAHKLSLSSDGDAMSHAASAMMLSSLDAWRAAYDDSTKQRGMDAVLAKWTEFLEFVEQAHVAQVTEKEVDPLAVDLASLTIF
jgi:hypothetical protein